MRKTLLKHTLNSRLKKKKHDEEVKEDWVQCNKCTKWVHQICGLYNPKLDKGPKAKPGANSKSAGKTGASSKANDRHEKFEFYCPQCLLRKMEEKKLSKSQRLSPKPSKSAIDLAKTNMTDYIEGFLNRRGKEAKERGEEEGERGRGGHGDEAPSANPAARSKQETRTVNMAEARGRNVVVRWVNGKICPFVVKPVEQGRGEEKTRVQSVVKRN